MNERFKQLAEQAGCAWWEGRALRDMSQCHHELEKFAELIVNECASVVYNQCDDGDFGAHAILYEFDIDGARSQK